ncbi:hypothetical protein H6781_01740 [Candidatus Nomurabacteria bacterium]|nr:hypothetical protein [Candidatus Nomurabacteria bacterium]MCB9818489.1 hypothetical protein [Candidatus Nomurabacteria bacterium]
MSEDTSEITLGDLLGVEKIPEDQRDAFLARVGNLLIDSSVARLLVSLDDGQVNKLEMYLENVSPEDDVFAYLLRTYPDFQPIVEKEIAALHFEASEIFGS